MKFFRFIFIILILIGLGVSFYLTFLHFSQTSAICGSNEIFNNCDSVLESEYAEILGIPIALLGIVFYFSTLILFLFSIFKKNKIFINLLFFAEIIGIIFSAIFTYIQFFIIKALCPYCLTSAIVTLILFLLSFYLKIKYNKK